MNSYAANALLEGGFDIKLRSAIYREAEAPARIAGVTFGNGGPDPISWLSEDWPARVNLILEALGRPERIAK